MCRWNSAAPINAAIDDALHIYVNVNALAVASHILGALPRAYIWGVGFVTQMSLERHCFGKLERGDNLVYSYHAF
jgi:hypothetical protein